MISPGMAKIIGYLPKGLLEWICKKMLYGYVEKYADLQVNGLENLKTVKRPILFICNHLSNSDALVINNVLKEEDITFVAGIKLSKNPLTNLGINITKVIPIKPNTADKDSISKIVKTLKAGNNVLIFPEGTRSRTSSMIKAKRGVFLVQKLSKASIVPLGIHGTDKLLPINKEDMGLEKFNYAKVTLSIGKQIEVPKKDENEDKHTYEERVVNFMMEKIAELLPESYRGVYQLK
ncbi:1-acyl-sn-glycerol-3-phosphate acyltransferase [Clostridium sp. P21]|uniref:1-acyl-sn-glycerol-3-phosphate acyltransferase n=1 Tax=Clostridium muellerianum TaxID=2716538 RepID=A0A7Y0EKS9_9CLOT|nr:lysophospholipid acyltransferase family protein [Clostridium muellerianum]NMM65293.1 1-acyl-sn-glycerol-3-phosphate acyltransferase [Clostridium muellerianum]